MYDFYIRPELKFMWELKTTVLNIVGKKKQQQKPNNFSPFIK